MTDNKLDRRVQRTRGLLNQALIQLLREKGYDAITIEDITERANLGRTTFYLHYQSKDDLLLDHYAEFSAELNLDKLTREQLLGAHPQPELVEFLSRISQDRAMYQAFTQAKDAEIIMRNIRLQMIGNLQESLTAAFPNANPNPPADILTRYLVVAQLQLIDWWVTSRTPYNAEQLADILHQLQTSTIRNAYSVLNRH